jgi:glyoxylase-like metal-dependent hydrolase (beta-lactamase superfamily II)
VTSTSRPLSVDDQGISVIPLPTPFAVGRVNCYLIEDDPLTLVDPGPRTGEALAELESGLATLGRGLEDVQLVLLTHQHIDHVGLAHTVKERSGAELAAPAPLVDYLADLDRSMDADDRFAAAVMELHGVPAEEIEALRQVVQAFRSFAASARVDRPLEEGDVLQLASRGFEVHSRPGHSPTDTIFVDRESQVALVGDHLLAEISSNPVLHRATDGPTDPRLRPRALAGYLDSLRRTAELDLTELLPGHGPPVTDHRALIAERLEFHRLRKERIYEELREGPRTAHAVALAVWEDIALQQVYLTLSEAIGHLDLLVAEGRVREVERDGSIVFAAL